MTFTNLTDDSISQMLADVEELMKAQPRSVIRITHYYDIGNQEVFVERQTGEVDAMRAALYSQFMCEEWFGEASVLTNLGVAAMLVMFYGYRQAAAEPAAMCRADIDMYCDREAALGALYDELMADPTLPRAGMREAMAQFVDGATRT